MAAYMGCGGYPSARSSGHSCLSSFSLAPHSMSSMNDGDNCSSQIPFLSLPHHLIFSCAAPAHLIQSSSVHPTRMFRIRWMENDFFRIQNVKQCGPSRGTHTPHDSPPSIWFTKRRVQYETIECADLFALNTSVQSKVYRDS
jgi:hypothetical protein